MLALLLLLLLVLVDELGQASSFWNRISALFVPATFKLAAVTKALWYFTAVFCLFTNIHANAHNLECL